MYLKTCTFFYLSPVSTVLGFVILTSTHELRNNKLARIKVTLFQIFEILRQKPVFRGPHPIKADRKAPSLFSVPKLSVVRFEFHLFVNLE